MCGIVGYVGKRPVAPLIVDSLKTLEYRGYDSAGIALLDKDHELIILKASGKLSNLQTVLDDNRPQLNGAFRKSDVPHTGIGHIRWATHGPATTQNAHPHTGSHQTIALVHNGIIENYLELKAQLQAKGRVFASDTDTECIVQLLEDRVAATPCATPDAFQALIVEATKSLVGAYALAIMHKDFPQHVFAVRHQAPLLAGVGDDESLVASDLVAVAPYTSRIVFLNDDEVLAISPQGLRLLNAKSQPIDPVIDTVNMGPLQIDKKGFKHFMMKEIHEQPDVVRQSLSGRLVGVDAPITLVPKNADSDEALSAQLKAVNRLVIVGCGTSYNAGLVGKYFIEQLVRLPVEVESAGEYRYRNPIANAQTLLIPISQSGETADTLQATRQAAQTGAPILTITNREDSSLARESAAVLAVRAGVEVSVCATKSFVAQIVVLMLLGIHMAELRQSAPPEYLKALKSALLKIPAQMETILANHAPVQQLAKQYSHATNMLFMARGINFPVAMEGALKLKEISYIHAEGYSGSELKHGPIAMLDENLPVVSILTANPNAGETLLFEKMLSNCEEVKARNAQLMGFIAGEEQALSASIPAGLFDGLVYMPPTLELLTPLLTAIPLQLLAYYAAEYLGKDVDQPRNLAKSVTVE